MSEREAVVTSDKQNGGKFSEEMKDYAKSTMNELLGMFGYEEEITREAVEELQIRLLPEDDENLQQMTAKPLEIEKDDAVAVDVNAGQNPVVVQIPGLENDSNAAVIPLPEFDNAVSRVPVEVPSLPQDSVNTSSETIKPDPALESGPNEVASSSDVMVNREGVYITFTASPGENYPLHMPKVCSWCKKSALLKDFASNDGKKVISCKGLCSAVCFEQAVKKLRESQNPSKDKECLQSPKLQGSNKAVKPGSSAPFTRSASKQSTAAKNDSQKPPKIPPMRGPKGIFSWDEYLAKTDSVAAPWSYFRQSATPPYNGFRRNMKLEVADPRIVGTMCVATVVGILGSRIRCRFDGTDSANDVWHLVDSKEIHPVGWCEGNGGRLQPPVGFKLDPGKYSTFLAKSLSRAELAPVRLFKREPTPPKDNLFKVGMKLEALDPKNPLLICVATVAGIDGEKIRVDFDGYLGSDYWCRYDSRDIFPVGWCYYSGHPLQPPGQTKKALKLSNIKTNEIPEKPAKPEKPDKQIKQRTPLTSPVTSVCAATSSVATPTSTTVVTASKEPLMPNKAQGMNYTVQVFINHSCSPGPYLNVAKVAKLPSCFRGTVLNVARDCFQSIVNAGDEPTSVFAFLKPGNGKARITCKNGKQTLSCHLQIMDRVARFWCVLDKLVENLQCCENLFSGERITGLCKKCGATASRRNTISRETSTAVAKKRTGPSLKRGAYKQREETKKRARVSIDEEISDDGQVKDRFAGSVEVSSPTVESTSPTTTWSVDEVVKFIEKSELAEYAETFKKHEIDGKALLLLTREMVMSYMGLKLGPAVKLLGCIEELKTKKST